jgi:hypothetical protein
LAVEVGLAAVELVPHAASRAAGAAIDATTTDRRKSARRETPVSIIEGRVRSPISPPSFWFRGMTIDPF